jgi:hypothetical protein
MAHAEGFEYKVKKSGEVVISHNGKKATVLRGDRAHKFLNRVKTRDPQEVMAKISGNYKRGNEKG